MVMTADHAKWPNYREGDFVIGKYVFRSGEMPFGAGAPIAL